MAETAPPKDGVRALLITQNITGVFDAIDEALEPWIRELLALVDRHSPDFIALHLQEMGGSDWQGRGMEGAAPFTAAIHKALPAFWSTGVLCNPDTTRSFSALGSMYLVRSAALPRVQLWHFGDAEQPASFRALADLPAPLLDEPCLPAHFCRHERFPQDFFPDFPNWSRKGYLVTRWQLGGEQLDLVNVHLFHDDSNLTALKRTESETQSIYATRRGAALRHTLREVVAEHPSTPPRPSLFVFGDFNFRLDLPAVVTHLCGAHGLARAQLHEPQAGALKLASADREADGTAEALCGDEEVVLEVGTKRFAIARPWELFADYPLARSFDRELNQYTNGSAALPLLELPSTFKPTYMHVRNTDEGKNKAHAPPSRAAGGRKNASDSEVDAAFLSFGRKRCPSWCDRVLMDAEGWNLVERSPVPPTYDAIEQGSAVICDHNKVFLAFCVS
ncbi:hypothetical protein AB1Y20_016096 [Prymnesium parvum]|uniref:inositol-polyphosphate 5-phosphatase n=1 Tax=Prymnesium parvum TaxID=97485 RepID=A0AB34JZS0_PRYPA